MFDSTHTAIGTEYTMLMSSLRVSVSKHLLDEYFTVVWANDYFYEKTGYSKEEYEAIYHNHCSEYFEQIPTEYAKIADTVRHAIATGEPSYALVCKMPGAVYGSQETRFNLSNTFYVNVLRSVTYC